MNSFWSILTPGESLIEEAKKDCVHMLAAGEEMFRIVNISSPASSMWTQSFFASSIRDSPDVSMRQKLFIGCLVPFYLENTINISGIIKKMKPTNKRA